MTILTITLILTLLILYWAWQTGQEIDQQERFAHQDDAPGQIMPIDGYDFHVHIHGDIHHDIK